MLSFLLHVCQCQLSQIEERSKKDKYKAQCKLLCLYGLCIINYQEKVILFMANE